MKRLGRFLMAALADEGARKVKEDWGDVDEEAW